VHWGLFWDLFCARKERKLSVITDLLLPITALNLNQVDTVSEPHRKAVLETFSDRATEEGRVCDCKDMIRLS
jgi:hypothetical protein